MGKTITKQPSVDLADREMYITVQGSQRFFNIPKKDFEAIDKAGMMNRKVRVSFHIEIIE